MKRVFLLLTLCSSLTSAVVAFAVATLVIPTATHAGPDPQVATAVVRAQRFELVDSSGTVRALLAVSPGDEWTSLELNDRAGNTHIGMAVTMDQAGVAIGQGDTHAHIRLSLFGQEPSIQVMNEAGAMADLGVNADGTMGFVGLDRNGQVRANLGLASDGQPTIRLLDTSGGTIWSAP
jgi:hypothetical protein